MNFSIPMIWKYFHTQMNMPSILLLFIVSVHGSAFADANKCETFKLHIDSDVSGPNTAGAKVRVWRPDTNLVSTEADGRNRVAYKFSTGLRISGSYVCNNNGSVWDFYFAGPVRNDAEEEAAPYLVNSVEELGSKAVCAIKEMSYSDCYSIVHNVFTKAAEQREHEISNGKDYPGGDASEDINESYNVMISLGPKDAEFDIRQK